MCLHSVALLMCKYSHISFGVKKVFFSISAPFILFLKLIALNYKRIITAKIIEVNVKNSTKIGVNADYAVLITIGLVKN